MRMKETRWLLPPTKPETTCRVELKTINKRLQEATWLNLNKFSFLFLLRCVLCFCYFFVFLGINDCEEVEGMHENGGTVDDDMELL